MGLYNFQKRFVPFVESGSKTHTIRAERKIAPKVGETLHLYTGLRQKGARLIMRVPCTRVERIDISLIGNGKVKWLIDVSIDGVPLDFTEKQQLAQRDGFKDFADMMTFWEGRLPFAGHIIHWKAVN